MPRTAAIWSAAVAAVAALLSAGLVEAQPPNRAARLAPLERVRTSYSDAKRIIYELRDDLLPPALQAKRPDEQEASFASWLSSHETTALARVVRGDEDSLVNLLLFGVTFTSQRRVDIREMLDGIAATGGREMLDGQLLRARTSDLIAGVRSPGGNERLQFARELMTRSGVELSPPAIARYLDEKLRRVFAEYERSFQQISSVAPYTARGLSTDTTWLPNFAIDQALAAIKAQGLFKNRLTRVGVIGPGLDFADKRDGHDFYPLQSIQPFAVLDSLARLELANPRGIGLWTLDLNQRVVGHLETARQRAQNGEPYTMVLLRDLNLPWHTKVVDYWRRLGDHVGRDIGTVSTPSAAGAVAARRVQVRPNVVLSTLPQQLNIVVERGELSPDERFDLIIATNVLTYYDAFEQSLALRNIATMLRPGALFLSNDPVVVLPAVPLFAVGSTAVQYTDLPNSRDEVIWYQR